MNNGRTISTSFFDIMLNNSEIIENYNSSVEYDIFIKNKYIISNDELDMIISMSLDMIDMSGVYKSHEAYMYDKSNMTDECNEALNIIKKHFISQYGQYNDTIPTLSKKGRKRMINMIECDLRNDIKKYKKDITSMEFVVTENSDGIIRNGSEFTLTNSSLITDLSHSNTMTIDKNIDRHVEYCFMNDDI